MIGMSEEGQLVVKPNPNQNQNKSTQRGDGAPGAARYGGGGRR